MVKKTIILKLWTKECTFQYVELRHIRINTEIIILFSSLFLSTILCYFFQFNSYYESQVFDIRVIYVINELFPVNMTIAVINNICLSRWKKHNFFNIFVIHSSYVGLILLNMKRSETYSLWMVFIKLLNEIEFWEIQRFTW